MTTTPRAACDNRKSTVWTDTIIARLRALAMEGVSAAGIAVVLWEEFGITVSRCAVIGKLYRLGLTKKRVPRYDAPRTRRLTVSAKMINLPRVEALKKGAEPIPPSQLEESAPPPERKTLLELTNEMCRWPFGDPQRDGFFFCGIAEADFIGGRPYCHFHECKARARTARTQNGELALPKKAEAA